MEDICSTNGATDGMDMKQWCTSSRRRRKEKKSRERRKSTIGVAQLFSDETETKSATKSITRPRMRAKDTHPWYTGSKSFSLLSKPQTQLATFLFLTFHPLMDQTTDHWAVYCLHHRKKPLVREKEREKTERKKEKQTTSL